MTSIYALPILQYKGYIVLIQKCVHTDLLNQNCTGAIILLCNCSDLQNNQIFSDKNFKIERERERDREIN